MSESTHEIALPGCTPTPLARYLKALGVLRLVSEQADAEARGWWQDDLFHLRSSLDFDGLIQFFLDDYRPTPILTPWNGGSGFYPKDKGARENGLEPILRSETDRLSGYRESIQLCLDLVDELGIYSSPKNEEKLAFLTTCRSMLPDYVVDWLDAAFALTNAGPSYPPMLGTGGIDARLDLGANFMQRVVDVIDPMTAKPSPRSRGWLEASLFSVTSHDRLRKRGKGKKLGQFLPGEAGGPNAAADFEGEAIASPWDYVLTLEGAVVFAGSVARQSSERGAQTLNSPFAVRAADVGYSTSSASDMKPNAAETWLPLWPRPALFSEIAALFAEGRATVGRRHACDGVDFARAIASLGIDRGISAFERFSYMERRGDASIAVPLERWEVPSHPAPRIRLLDELDGWLTSLQDAARQKRTPQKIKRALHRIQSAMMDVCRHDLPDRWQTLLMALGAAEQTMVHSPSTTARQGLSPLPSLSTGWLRACDDGSPEYRLALSLASIRAEGDLGPLRANMVPLADWRRWPRFKTEGGTQSPRLKRDPAVVWGHGDLVTNLTAALMRRCMEAKRLGLEALPLHGTRPARLDDIGAFISGEIDEEKLDALLWGLNAVWLDREWEPPNYSGVLPAAYALLKLSHLPHPLEPSPGADPVPIRYDPEISRLACAGRMTEATDRAAHRLRASGLPVATRGAPETPQMSRRIAAALLFPISQKAVERLCDHVLLPREPQAV